MLHCARQRLRLRVNLALQDHLSWVFSKNWPKQVRGGIGNIQTSCTFYKGKIPQTCHIYLRCLRSPQKRYCNDTCKNSINTKAPPPFCMNTSVSLDLWGHLMSVQANGTAGVIQRELQLYNMMYRNHLLHLSHKKPSCFPLYWLFKRDPYTGWL